MNFWERDTDRRRFMQGLVVAMPSLSVLIAACSSNSASGTSSMSTIDTKQNVTLRMSNWWGDNYNNYIPTLQQDIGIGIKNEVTDVSQYEQKLLVQLASGTAPDIFLLDSNNNGDIFPTHLAQPFDDYLAHSGIDMSKWNTPPKKEVGFNGQTLGLSVFTMQDLIVHVNKPLADADGLLANAPLWGTSRFDTWKWDDFVNWLKAGTKVVNGQVQQYGLGTLGGVDLGPYGLVAIYRCLLGDNGGSIFDDDWNYNETVSKVDSPESIDAAQKIADLVRVHKVAPTPGDEGAIPGGTYRGKKAVSTIFWSTPSTFPESTLFPQEYFHLPYITNKVHAVGANQLMVNAKGNHVDAALEWCTRFCVDTQIRTLFLQKAAIPSWDPLPIVNASPEGTPKKIALINLARIPGITSLPTDAQNTKLYPRWYGKKASAFTQQTLQDALSKAVLGTATAQAAMTAAKQAIDAQLKSA